MSNNNTEIAAKSVDLNYPGILVTWMQSLAWDHFPSSVLLPSFDCCLHRLLERQRIDSRKLRNGNLRTTKCVPRKPNLT